MGLTRAEWHKKIDETSDERLAILTLVEEKALHDMVAQANAIDDRINELKLKHAEELQRRRTEDREDALRRYGDNRRVIEELQKQVDALGGTELGKKMAKEKELAYLRNIAEGAAKRITELSK